MVLDGWPEELEKNEEWKPFETRKDELSVEGGTLLWGNRVVIPKTLRSQVLEQLHEAHVGVCKMKALARCYVWWPGLDKDVEKVSASCENCLAHRSNLEKSSVHSWEQPQNVWERLHVDYAGPFMGKMFLLVVDAHSKWLDVHVTKGSTTRETVEKLRHSFAVHGVPRVIVSDNGTCFTSNEFQEFCRKNNVKHVTSAPYHPATNGLAERNVRTFKEALKKWRDDDNVTVETKVERFLFAYRNTPHTVTGLSPAQVLLKRRPRTPMSGLKSGTKRMEGCERKEPRSFAEGQSVMTRNFSRGDKWIQGVVEKRTGPLSYHVRVDGGTVRRHTDQVITRQVKEETEDDEDNSGIQMERKEFQSEVVQQDPLQQDAEHPVVVDREETVPEDSAVPEESVLRRSGRERRKPAWLEGFC